MLPTLNFALVASCLIFACSVLRRASSSPASSSDEVRTIAGTPSQSYTYGSVGTYAGLGQAYDVAADSDSDMVYFTERAYNRVLSMNLTSLKVSIIVGAGAYPYPPVNGLGTYATLYSPAGLALDSTNRLLYVCDTYSNRVRLIDLKTNIISTFVGGVFGSNVIDNIGTYSGFGTPWDAALVNAGLYVIDGDLLRYVITTTRQATTVAGNFAASNKGLGPDSHRDGFGTFATFYRPLAICAGVGNTVLYIADYGNNLIRAFTISNSRVRTLAGSISGLPSLGISNQAPNNAGHVDALGTFSTFSSPISICYDPINKMIVVGDNANSLIRRIDESTGITSTFAGTLLSPGFDDGAGTFAKFFALNGLTYKNGVMFIADGYELRTIGFPIVPPEPTASPTTVPTTPPSAAPTRCPTVASTFNPSKDPTNSPTASPTTPAPTSPPTTTAPSAPPTTNEPTTRPTTIPSTSAPTTRPTFVPTLAPSTLQPSQLPSTASPVAASATSGQAGLPTGAVVGIAIGCALLGCCCIFLALFFYRRRREAKVISSSGRDYKQADTA